MVLSIYLLVSTVIMTWIGTKVLENEHPILKIVIGLTIFLGFYLSLNSIADLIMLYNGKH